MQNAAWDAAVNITVPPGKYTVIDTDNATWAQNPTSGGRGFARIAATGPTNACLAPSSKKNVPFGGNCHGAGCDHPDLTAYGGNGPASSGTDIHLHLATPPGALLAGSLSPVTSVPAFLQRCMGRGGHSIMLIDDESWYYYFVGFYARFACLL